MEKITYVKGCGIPIRGNDIDTDQIIPARYMTAVTFEGIEEYCFYDQRYNADGSKKAHPLNDPKYKNATIMIVNDNFGCGSSREHAPQTIMRYGFQALIGESFAEIFSGNCTTLGVPVINLSREETHALQDLVERNPDVEIEIDLLRSTVIAGSTRYQAIIPAQIQNTLTQGTWDTADVLLQNAQKIEATYTRLPYIHHFK